jgi:hypothetical protein
VGDKRPSPNEELTKESAITEIIGANDGEYGGEQENSDQKKRHVKLEGKRQESGTSGSQLKQRTLFFGVIKL